MNPYKSLPSKAFWRPAVADRSMFAIDELWSPKFDIKPDARVATFGSCFAQHIGNALKNRGFNWLIAERPPFGLSSESAKTFNYNVFSCRTGNIYTTSLLRQWTSWALGESEPPAEYWGTEGAYFDPFRPAVEPGGFETLDELRRSRQVTIDAFRSCIEESHYFVFTLGLTESWFNKTGKYEYPMCPGTVAGEFDEHSHTFVNQQFEDVRANLIESIRMMRRLNARLRFILTVSPVPLTATKSGDHVVVATMYSKSVLRAVAGQISQNRKFVDYFPSYEIINSPVFRGGFFQPNQRNVDSHGVDFVMGHFFRSLASKFGEHDVVSAKDANFAETSDDVCEEELLDAFGGAR